MIQNRKDKRHRADHIKSYKAGQRYSLLKRVLCFIVVSAMVFPLISDIFQLDFFMEAAAATESDITYDSTTHTVTIGSPADLVTFSQVYAAYNPEDDTTIDHSADTISIAFGSGNSTALMTGYIPLGTASNPFKGTLKIATSSSLNIFRLDDPFFGYVCDSASIISTESLQNATMEIMVTKNDTMKPVLANHVVHDADHDWEQDSVHEWSVKKSIYVPTAQGENTHAYTTAGIIGQMDEDAQLIINVEDNVKQSGAGIDYPNANVNGNTDIGYICHVMETGSKLTVKTAGGTNDDYTITTSSGNAGGVVGVMKEGSVLTMKCNMNQTDAHITAAGSEKYAGGIVGKCEGGTIVLDSSVFSYTDSENNNKYQIGNVITGVAGAGGVAGYYRPKLSTGASTFDVLLFDTSSARVEGTGSVGGLFGVLVNKTVVNNADAAGGTVTITDSQNQANTITASHTISGCTNYGGLVGLYQAYNLADTLIVENVSASSSTSQSYNYFGGGIGCIQTLAESSDNSAYVRFNGTDFSVTSGNNGDSSSTKNYGGLVGQANNSFIDTNNITVNNGSGFKGGGVVGSITDGVIRLTGSTTLTGSVGANSYYTGQLVGFRDDSVIFAENGWVYNRMTACAVDDIGSWGEVVRFVGGTSSTDAGTGHTLKTEIIEDGRGVVLTVDETAHTVTIGAHAVTTDAETNIMSTSVGSLTDFAKAALCFTIDASSAPAISFASGSSSYSAIKNANITLTGNIDLSGSGLTGFTRDNDAADNASVSAAKCVYSGQFDGGGFTISLSTGEVFGYRNGSALPSNDTSAGNGKIYFHRYNGLFGILDRTISDNSDYSIKDVTFSGAVTVCAARGMYVGSAAGRVTNDLKTSNVHSRTVFNYGGSSVLYLGRLVGDCSSSIKSIHISGTSSSAPSVFSGNVTGNNSNSDSCIGGVIGIISHATNAARSWNFSNVKSTGTISNTNGNIRQQLGGLIAVIKSYPWLGENDDNANAVFNSRALTLNGVVTDGLIIKGKLKNTEKNHAVVSMGGLLGYSWLNTDVNFADVDINNSSKVSLISTNANKGDFAGLVYAATGKWTVTDLVINSIVVETTDGSGNAGNARSFGMLVNKGFNGDPTSAGSSAIYMLLPSTTSYSITSCTFNDMPTPGTNFDFDELVTYSAYYRNEYDSEGNPTGDHIPYPEGDPDNLYILQNGCGVVSIKTSTAPGLVMDGSTASNSYAARTSFGAYPNPYSRYYYNLDTLTSNDPSALTTPQKKLMSWALAVYAHRSIKTNFATTFTAGTIENLTYNMTGYSWYPVDIDTSGEKTNGGFYTSSVSEGVTTYTWHSVAGTTVNGTFTFANKEFELSEKAKYDANTSTECDRTSLYYSLAFHHTQHYLLHEGLFRNVTSTLNVGTVVLSGDIGAVVSSDSAASVCGALVCGLVEGKDSNHVARVNMTNGSISLKGISVHNLSAKTGTYGLVSSAYAPLLINKSGKHSSLVISDVSNTSDYNSGESTAQAATSLIGNVGYSTAENVNINFSIIKLDARTSHSVAAGGNLDAMYHTYSSIFTKASLLHSFSYASGSGVYNYTWGADWDIDNDGNADTPHNGNVTYGLELWDGSDSAASITNSLSGRTQYIGQEHCYAGSTVYTSPVSSAASAPYNFAGFLPYVYTAYDEDEPYYQLEVNHSVIVLEGCGTYNDPYVLASGTKLMTVANWINGGSFAAHQEICVPNGLSSANYRNTLWCGNDHVTYSSTGTTFEDSGNNQISFENMRKYLAGAYYIIDADSQTQPDPETGLQTVTSITIESGFKGFGNTTTDANRFRGVIDGNGKTIINATGYPLIYYSNGSVVRDLTLHVTGNVTLYGNNNSFGEATTITTSSSGSGNNQVTTVTNEGGNEAYGAVIGRIMGGDNIIDNVSLALGTPTDNIDLTIRGKNAQYNYQGNAVTNNANELYAQLVPVGGYVGVVVNGGLIFRNMSRSNTYDSTLFRNVNFKAVANKNSDTSPMSDSNNEWLYVNPIVGRVIGGYVINESTDNKYRPYESGTRTYTGGTTDETDTWADGAVTLQNGTKHYSIADVDSTSAGGKLSITSGRAITVPDGQSLFMLSLITNGGMGIKSAIHNKGTSEPEDVTLGTKTGYYDGYYTVRSASYADVGCGKSALSSSYSDYVTFAAKDNYYGSFSATYNGFTANYYRNYRYNPYLIRKYTQETSDVLKYNKGSSNNLVVNGEGGDPVYYAGIIAYNTNTSTITLSGASATYTLPDGFRGINRFLGNGTNDDNSVNAHSALYVREFSGNGNTISQNTVYRYYQNNANPYDTYYNPYKNTEAATGLGLFNRAPYAGSYFNLKLKGIVKVEIIKSGDKEGSVIDYSNGNCFGKHYILSAGMLIGQNFASQTINAVALNNADVFSPKYAGGLIGNSAGDVNKTITISNKIEVENSSDISYDSNNIRVRAGVIAGGLIGRMRSGKNEILILDYNEKNYKITEVVSVCSGGVNGNYYEYGVGGLVGVLRGNNTQSTVDNINIISSSNSSLSYVKVENANIYAGGMFGILNRTNIKVNNCNIKNILVESAFASGGIVGHWATSVNNTYSGGRNAIINAGLQTKISNVHISCDIPNTIPEIKSTGTDDKYSSAGGFIASGKEDMFDVCFDNCSISGYSISGKVAAGGVVGIWGDTSTTGTSSWDQHILVLDNVVVSDCSVRATGSNIVSDGKISGVQGCAGGLVGKLSNGSRVQYSCATGTGSSGNGVKNGVGNQANSIKIPTYGNYYVYGYNVLTSNLTISGNSGNAGYICGANTYIQHNCIMIAGYSRQDTRSTPNMCVALVGARYEYEDIGGKIVADKDDNRKDSYILSPDGNYYGAKLLYSTTDETNKEYAGYVVFADYEGLSLDASTRKTTWSGFAGSNAYNVAISSPYVTSSGFINISNDGSQYLTADGIDHYVEEGEDETIIDYAHSAIGHILGDVSSYSISGETITANPVATEPKRYAFAYSEIEALSSGSTGRLIKKLYSDQKYSSYNSELSTFAGPDNDFPVLVIDDVHAANTTELINNYIRYLTNTDFNYARNSLGNTDDAEMNTATAEVYRIVIGTCVWDDENGRFNYSAADPNLQQSSGQFKMKSGSYDNGGSIGQFTLIDVQYLDPGDTSHTKVAFHLYIPVVVEKIMRYDFRATFLTGTTYVKQPYFNEWNDAIGGNSLIENIGNPVTLELHYTYQKTIAEWNAMVESGESLLYTYPKKMQVIDATNLGLPTNTRMVLLDPNAGNRFFYGSNSVYQSGTSNYLNLNSFHANKDGTGAAFTSVYMNDFFNVSVSDASGAGKYDKVTLAEGVSATPANYISAGAVIRNGDDYYKYKENNDGAYNITISYKDGVWDNDSESENYGYLGEDYYITFFTPESDIHFYHLEFFDPGTFNYSAYPSVVDTNYHSHLLTGKIFKNDFSITETNTTTKMSLAPETLNDTIGAQLTARVGIEDAIRSTIFTYLGFDSVKVYQSFLLSLNEQNSASDQVRGIQVRPKVSFGTEGFKINNGEDISEDVAVIIGSNFIEFRDGVDLSSYLQATCNTSNAAYGQDVVIQTTVNLKYDNKDDMEDQFPLRDTSEENNPSSVIGTKMLGSSNLSSSVTSAAYSKTVDEKWGERGLLYFITTASNAKLTLNSDDAGNQNGEYDQLGINARDMNSVDSANGYVPMKLRAFYDVSDVGEADSAAGMKLIVTVRRKDDYTDAGVLPINEYVTDLVIGDRRYDSFEPEDENDEYVSAVTTSSAPSATSYVYVIQNPKTVFSYVNEAGKTYYEIPITLSVYTGTGDSFEGDTIPSSKFYANYMIDLKAELYYDTACGNYIEGTRDNDHVIWTNAKILTEVINLS